LTDYLHKLQRLNQTSYAEIKKELADKNAGAIPSDEFERLKTFSVNFVERWTNHEKARVWANEILQNRTTFAADGSQLFSEREVSLPVGAIQIGWFENPHDATQRYEKNAFFEILSPEVLLQEQEEPIVPETRVGERRFHAEVEKASEFLKRKKAGRHAANGCRSRFLTGRCSFLFLCRRLICKTLSSNEWSRWLNFPVRRKFR
jgi:hypothetical protein